MMGLKFGTQELIDEYIDKLNNNKVMRMRLRLGKEILSSMSNQMVD